ncbi:MAG: histidine kinase, partial [bacterium]|nr:histidine kinase [bacterium]
MKNIVLFTLMLVLITDSLYPATATEAQKNIQFRHLNAGDGLSQGTVPCILQDSKGFMWFGTMMGLNKYDGNSFTHFQYDFMNSNSISSDVVQAIHEDGNGILWLLTNAGLNKFDPKSETFRSFKHPNDRPGGVTIYRCLSEDAS